MTGDIVRLDLAGGKVRSTRSHLEPAEWARRWRSRRTEGPSGATGKRAYVLDAVLVHEAVSRSGAEETQCYAYI